MTHARQEPQALFDQRAPVRTASPAPLLVGGSVSNQAMQRRLSTAGGFGPGSALALSPEPAQVHDVSVVRTDETLVFNQDERYNERQVQRYCEGWVDVGGGRQRRVSFVVTTTTHTPQDPWQPGYTTTSTEMLWNEPEYRSASGPLFTRSETQIDTQRVVNIPPPQPVEQESGGVLSSIGGFFRGAGRFLKGVGESAWGMAKGLYHVVRHPIQTMEGLYQIVRHPIRTAQALYHAVKERGRAILSGDWEALGQTVGDIATLLLAPEAEAAKTGQLAEVAEVARAAEAEVATADVTQLSRAVEAEAGTVDVAGATSARTPPLPDETLDEAARVVEQQDQPFSLHVGERRGREIQSGQRHFVGDQPIGFDIDEPLPVGAPDVSRQRAVQRALDPHNRELLDPMTNRRTKYLGVDPRAVERNRIRLPEVSVADDPGALLTRRFDEVTEMRQVWDEAVNSVENVRSLSPTAIKERINANIRRIIGGGTSPAGAQVRDALRGLGFEYVPGRGIVAVRRPPAL